MSPETPRQPAEGCIIAMMMKKNRILPEIARPEIVFRKDPITSVPKESVSRSQGFAALVRKALCL